MIYGHFDFPLFMQITQGDTEIQRQRQRDSERVRQTERDIDRQGE